MRLESVSAVHAAAQRTARALTSLLNQTDALFRAACLTKVRQRVDRKAKFDAYERYGVAEYWVVEPKLRGVEVYSLSNGEYALLGQYTGTALVESQVLAGLQLKANDLFSPVQ